MKLSMDHFYRASMTVALMASSPALHAEPMEHAKTWNIHDKWSLFGDLEMNGQHFGKLQLGSEVLANVQKSGKYKHAYHLFSKEHYRDLHLKLEFMLPTKSNSGVYFMSRYEIQLLDSYGKGSMKFADLGGLYQRWDNNKNPKGFEGVAPRLNAAKPAGEWQSLEVIFRAPRFAADGSKSHHAKFLKVAVNDQLVLVNQVAKGPTRAARHKNESAAAAPLMIQGDHGAIAIRNVEIKKLELSTKGETALSGAESAPLDSHGRPSINAVALGKEIFKSKGCAECHGTSTEKVQKSGPSLYGLFAQSPKQTKIYIPSEGHHKQVAADFEYLKSSLRQSMEELAYQDDGSPYLPIMPPFSFKHINDDETKAIFAYLKTLNPAETAGPAIQWIETPNEKYVLADDPIAIWVKNHPRLERADGGEHLSARAYHVGLPGDISYSFDPRTMAIAQVWDGPFLRKRDQVNRGRGGVQRGHQSRDYQINNLFQPLDRDGRAVDLTFASPAKMLDQKQTKQFLADRADVIETIRAFPAKFIGTDTPRHKNPGFLYQVNENKVTLNFTVSPERKISAKFEFNFQAPQVFLIPTDKLKAPWVSIGEIKGNQWHVPAGKHISAEFRAELPKLAGELYTSDLAAEESYEPQKLKFTEVTKGVTLPAGYKLENVSTPDDPFGRPLVFEPMGIEFHHSEAFVSTRTAGIWKVVDDHWHHFADATYDSLGIVINSANEIVIGEKPGLTRLIDADGDHWAERREVVSDQFRFNGDYHEYLHGPVRFNDKYLFSLNLGNEVRGMYKAKGKWMGTAGGLRGWMLIADDAGNTSTFASGFRSPAGLAVSPNNEIVYTENQGEFVGTSKVFIVEKGKFYGNPTGLIDIEGMNTESPEVQWDAVKETRELPIALLPHNEVMNAPGSPEFFRDPIKFGPFTGQMLLGDQLQSNLYRVDLQEVDGIRQSVALPFMQGLSSGAMRLRFNPQDSSLWIGQTGRGWRAKGGQKFSLQRLSYDSRVAVDAIQTVKATPRGFDIRFTKAQPETQGASAIMCHSWYYQDSPNYGSERLGQRSETVQNAVWNEDRTVLSIALENFRIEQHENPEFSSRIYRLDLSKTAFGNKHGEFLAKAYFTLHAIPKH